MGWIGKFFKKPSRRSTRPIADAAIIPRDQHSVSRAHISDNALKVLKRLDKAGYAAYLVGGGVRDLLLGHQPKDFDIATDAKPEEINKLFRNCRLIGRRFRLAHIFFGRDIIEVATFRADTAQQSEDRSHSMRGRILRDNVYGSLEEDVWRRDFSINALYYNIADFSIVDYTGGMTDLKNRMIRVIGDPIKRYKEDPIRMLRAVRLAAKLDLSIEEKTRAPIFDLSHLLDDVPPARLFDELLKMLLKGHAEASFNSLLEYNLFKKLFPQTVSCLDDDKAKTLIRTACAASDARIRGDQHINPAFIFAVILWPPLFKQIQGDLKKGKKMFPAAVAAIHAVTHKQLRTVSIPRRFTTVMRDIWMMQFRFEHRKGKRVNRTLENPRFRAAYDFLMLRAQADPSLQELVDWWGARRAN